MSEVEEKPQTSELVSDKSDDKLQIEKEEKQKAEDIVGEMFNEKEIKEKEEAQTEVSEVKEEVKNEEVKSEESPAKETEEATGSEEKTKETEEKKEDEKPEGKDKKFSLPKIKAPKIINEIRSRSKSREKKKNKEKDDGGAEGGKPEGDDKKTETEGEGAAAAEAGEAEAGAGAVEEAEDKKDLVKEARTKVKDAFDNIHLPKMPKMHKPGFMKKKSKEEGEKTEEKAEEENKAEESKEDKSEETLEVAKEGDKEETEEKEEKEDKSEEGGKADEKKTSIIDSLKNIKSQVFPKSKKGEAPESGEKSDEAEKLLEEKEKTEEKKDEEKEKEKGEGSSLLQRIRNVASGVPALFKKDTGKEADVEAGEKDELLEKKEDKVDGKEDELKMEEIKLEDEKKEDDPEKKEDEKKDPEKGEVMEEKSELDRLKRLPGDIVREFQGWDRQRQYSLLGIIAGVFLLLLIIIVAATTSGGWQNHHQLVEDGRYVETQTSCGAVWGAVEGEDRFMFRNLPYSVAAQRFSHSRLAASLEECGDRQREPSNETVRCLRRGREGVEGQEDCLVLHIATTSVVYSRPSPVVVVVTDEVGPEPSTVLAYQHGVVMVSVEVRQGVLGYLSHPALSRTEKPPTSGNYALGDLITALQWIQLNIRHFGGDPDQVTILGHRQGASLATGLTAVQEARSLYHRLWLSAGSGNLQPLSLEQAGTQHDRLVRAVCANSVSRDCLVQADAQRLFSSAGEEMEPWRYEGLPERREAEMPGYLVTDTKIITDSLEDIWTEHPVTVPIVFGVPAQVEANPTNYQLFNWNNTDLVDSKIENSLGNFDITLSGGALKLYNQSNNWSKYISMVSDIRSVCPLDEFANNFKKRFSDSHVSFYINQEAAPSSAELNLGEVAPSTSDLAAIFGSWNSEQHKYGDKLQRKFFQFVKSYIQKLTPEVLIFDTVNKRFTDKRCNFWLNGTNSLIPKYGRKF